MPPRYVIHDTEQTRSHLFETKVQNKDHLVVKTVGDEHT